MEFIKTKQLLEYGINEVFTYPDGTNHIVYLAFRGWASAAKVKEAADYLSDKQVELAIHCGNDGKFDISFHSYLFTQSINVTSILGSSSILFLREWIKDGNVKVVLYVYYNEDRIVDGKIDFTNGDELCVEIPLDVSTVKVS